MKPDQTNQTPDVHDDKNINAIPDTAEPATGTQATTPSDATSTPTVQPTTSRVQPSQPAAGTGATTQPFSPQPQKSKKGLIIGAVVAAVVAVGLIGGGIGAYAWYQNPDKVLDDALVHSFTEKKATYDAKLDFTNTGNSSGSFNANYQTTSDGKKMAVSYDASADISGTKVKLDGGAYYEVGGAYYVKVNGINKLLNDYMDAQGISRSEMPSAILDIINKVDNKWISISEADLKELAKGDDEAVKVKQCTDTVLTNMEKDSSYANELATLYQKNRFILIDKSLGSRDGAVGFELKGDESKAKEFVKGLKDTKVVKEYRDCLPADQRSSFDKTFDDTSSKSSSSSDDVTIEIWIDQWSHKMRTVKMTGDSSDSKMTLEMTAKPFDASKLVKPNEDTTARELKDDVEKLMESYQQSASSYSTPSSSLDSF